MSGRSKITRISGTSRLSMTVAATTSSVVALVTPTLFGRTTNIQKGFEFYRFTKLQVTVPPVIRNVVNGGFTDGIGSFSLGYYPEVTTATTTTINDSAVAGLEASLMSSANLNQGTAGTAYGIPGQTHTRVLSVPKRILLATPAKWYRTNATASSEDLEITQGTLILAVANADASNGFTVRMQVRFTVEFSAQVDSTLLTLTPPKPTDTFSDVPDSAGMVLVNEPSSGSVWVDRDDFKAWLVSTKKK